MQVRFDMATCRVGQKRALTEHFKQRAVIKFCANSELTPTETWTFLENITVGKRVLDRSFLTGTSDIGTVERTSATISGVGDPVVPAADLSTLKSQLRGTIYKAPEKRRVRICCSQCSGEIRFRLLQRCML